MFNFLTSVVKTAASVVNIPVTIVADVITLGGSLTDREVPYTYDACSDLIDNLKDVVKPLSK
jgi:hypothetical protein